jgi:hypothetical protein
MSLWISSLRASWKEEETTHVDLASHTNNKGTKAGGNPNPGLTPRFGEPAREIRPLQGCPLLLLFPTHISSPLTYLITVPSQTVQLLSSDWSRAIWGSLRQISAPAGRYSTYPPGSGYHRPRNGTCHWDSAASSKLDFNNPY